MKSLGKIAFAASFVVASGVAAQPTPVPAPTPAPLEAPDEAGGANSDGQLGIPPMPTGDALVAKLDELDAQRNGDLKHVKQLRIRAKKEKDSVKVNCVNDKLVYMNGLMNVVDLDRRRLEETSDLTKQEAAYIDIVTNVGVIRITRDEANTCVGEGISTGTEDQGASGPDLPDDPSEDGLDGEGIEHPGYRTPFS